MGIAGVETAATAQRSFAPLAAQRALLYEDRLGTICHRAIAWLLTNDLPLTERAAVKATDAVLARRVAPVYRASIRSWVAGAVVRYDTHFRRSSAWRFLGAEAITGDVALDLIWVDSRGHLEADELKTGLSPAGRSAQSFAQATAQASEAAAVFGARFQAVRLIVLTKPELSLVVRPDGSSRPLFASADDDDC